MIFFFISLIAGFLTVLTPCVLPILPIVLGSSVMEGKKNRKRPFIVIASLILSVFTFTFLLKVSSAFINVPEYFWDYFSGGIIAIFGLSILLPDIWSRVTAKLFASSNEMMNASFQNRTKWWGDIALGASLGPIFTTCSPTFFIILATVLPSSLTQGVVYLLAYCFGLALALLLIVFIGQKVLLKFSYLSDPNSSFKKVLGWIFIIFGILIAIGTIKKIEAQILNSGFVDFTKIERNISDFLSSIKGPGEGQSNSPDQNSNNPQIDSKNQNTTKAISKKSNDGYPIFKYKEIINPSGFVNSEPFQLKDIVGKKVILLDFMTYSCINCQRTFPYLNAWYQKYKDEGLEIVAIHTPEFSFEKNIDNVRKAALDFGLKFPIVLDNDYATWNAYGNSYWPRKYLIDINGNVVYDHIGEGDYDKIEDKIVELLKERAEKTGTYVSGDKVSMPEYSIYAKSPETYFGAMRNNNFGNGTPNTIGQSDFTIPDTISNDKFYLGGTWNIDKEYAENISAPAKLDFKFNSKEVYLVASGDADLNEKEIEIYIDGSMMSDASAGKDAKMGIVKIKESRLYHLISLPTAGSHTLEIRFKNPKTRIYTFTFG